jgi:hypothetical protein
MNGSQAQPTRCRAVDDCLSEAILFVAAQSGGAQRLLAAHEPDTDGRCVACGRQAHWPCVLVTIARQAVPPETVLGR